MLFHFDQRLGPRLLFDITKVTESHVKAALTRLMDFNFLIEMKAFVNAMANVVYTSMFFSINNPLARGGREQFMLSVVVFEPTITEYLMISSLEEELSKTISKLVTMPEMLIIVSEANPKLEDYPDIAELLYQLKDKAISVFEEFFYGQFEGGQDAISELLRKIGNEAGKNILSKELHENKNSTSRTKIISILDSPIVGRWGKFSLLHYDPYEKVATISVKNSIWTESIGVIATKTCAFIEGMLEAIFSSVLNENVVCREMRCASQYSYVTECMFQISPSIVGEERVTYREEQTIREIGFQEREKTLELLKKDIGLELYYQIDDPMIRLNQLFNKAPFISDFYFDESKFLVVCNYWRYPDEIMCSSCETWIRNTTKVDIKLTKSQHRLCEIIYKLDNKNERCNKSSTNKHN